MRRRVAVTFFLSLMLSVAIAGAMTLATPNRAAACDCGESGCQKDDQGHACAAR
jgi:hypothetical protein